MALDARYLKRKQRALGGLYQSVLRAELTHRYGVAWGPIENGQAEIAGMPAELLDAFSKRTAQVDAALADKIDEFRDREGRDPSRWERAALTREAAADTRAAKTDASADDAGERAGATRPPRSAGRPPGSSRPARRRHGARRRRAADRRRRRRAALRQRLDLDPRRRAAGGLRPRPARVAALGTRLGRGRRAGLRPGRRAAASPSTRPTRTGPCARRTAGRSGSPRSSRTSPTSASSPRRNASSPSPSTPTSAPPGPSPTRRPRRPRRPPGRRRRRRRRPRPARPRRRTRRHRQDHDAAPRRRRPRTRQRRPVFGGRADRQGRQGAARRDRHPRRHRRQAPPRVAPTGQPARPPTGSRPAPRSSSTRPAWSAPAPSTDLVEPRRVAAVATRPRRRPPPAPGGRPGRHVRRALPHRPHPRARHHPPLPPPLGTGRRPSSCAPATPTPSTPTSTTAASPPAPSTTSPPTSPAAGSTTPPPAAPSPSSPRPTNTSTPLNARHPGSNAASSATSASRAVRVAGGETAAVGDIVATRRNDRTLRTDRGEPVRNRDRWTVADVHRDGSLTVSHLHGHGTVTPPRRLRREPRPARLRRHRPRPPRRHRRRRPRRRHRRHHPPQPLRRRHPRPRTRTASSSSPTNPTQAARDVLEQVLTNDRADIPAVTQRRRLAEQQWEWQHTWAAPPDLHPLEQAAAQARHAFTAAENRAGPQAGRGRTRRSGDARRRQRLPPSEGRDGSGPTLGPTEAPGAPHERRRPI